MSNLQNPTKAAAPRVDGLIGVGLFPLIGCVVSVALVPVMGSGWSGLAFLLSPIGIVVAAHTAHTALMACLWLRYRPFSRPEKATLPHVSVVIPAFNEGRMVARSIRSVAKSNYPLDKLEVIVVDDGSRDDTFFHMRHLRKEFPELVRLVRFSGNRGKRAALREGLAQARGEIAVTIDSDSEVDPNTITEMVAPFLADKKVGAVAGRVAVLNRDSFISRMLEVQYALAFDFGRAAQSVYRAVACCPGALSAFRLSVIAPHLDTWTQQTFLGRPVNHGEDQALTNIVLRAGFDTVYQSSAVIHTLAPTQYRPLTKMFVRWDRSYIVEGFSFARFMFTRYRDKNRLLPIIGFMASTLRFVALAYFLIGIPSIVGVSAVGVSASGLFAGLLALLVGAAFSALYYLRIEKSFRFVYGIAYAIFSALCLQWILPWALITVRDERWGTR